MPLAQVSTVSAGHVQGLEAVLDAARVPEEAVSALTQDVAGLGAVHVSELSRDDWLRLTAFQSLRDLEKRRLLRAAGR